MKVWAVANQKGGVGKTTTVVTLGGLLSTWGYRTLLIDLDPHGSLTSYFNHDPDSISTSVYNLFHDASHKKKEIDPTTYIKKSSFDNLSVLPASTAIATLDRQVASMGGMGLVIATTLRKLSDRFDFVLIDSPPMLGVLMINALAACDHLILPVLSEYLAIKGLERMLRTTNMVFNSRKIRPKYTIVPTMFDKRTKATRACLDHLRQNYRDTIWTSYIPVDTKVREASQALMPLPLFTHQSKSLQAYEELMEMLLQEESQYLPQTAIS